MSARPLFCAVIICFIGTGCFKMQNTPNPNPVSPAPTEEAIGQFGYKLSGKNTNDESCSTGVKNFQTLHLMCINIQDPVQNNDCALTERISKFNNDCGPQGYDFYESHVCHISLIDKNADISTFGDYDRKYLIKTLDYCAGRTHGGMTIGGVHDASWFIDNIEIAVDMEFVPRHEAQTSGGASYFKMTMRKQLGDGSFQPFVNEHVYNDGASVTSGVTLDGAYKYLLDCGNTWACI